MKIEFSDAFKKAFNRTADYIAQDGGMRKSELAESVLDAGRMASLGGPDGKAADDEASSLIKQHGWVPVRKAAEKLL